VTGVQTCALPISSDLFIHYLYCRHIALICKARTHSNPLFKIRGFKKMNDIFAPQVSSFMYKYNANILPMNFINNFTKNSATHVHNNNHNHQPLFHFTLRLNSVIQAGSCISNNLPHDLKLACSLSVFNR